MTVREFMEPEKSRPFIDIRYPVYDENGSLIRYESIQGSPVEWPNIKGIDVAILDRKIHGWSLEESHISGVPIIIFDTVKGE